MSDEKKPLFDDIYLSIPIRKYLELQSIEKMFKNRPRREITYDDINNVEQIPITCNNTIYPNNIRNKFLSCELLRFLKETGREPTAKDMKSLNGFPNNACYVKTYPSRYTNENALKGAMGDLFYLCRVRNLSMPKYESIKVIKTIEKFNLFSMIERRIINTLECTYERQFKLKYRGVYCEKYGNMEIKFSTLNKNMWIFTLRQKLENKQEIDNFICVAMDEKNKNIQYIWSIDNTKFNTIKNLKIYNTEISLKRLEIYDIAEVFDIEGIVLR